MICPFTVLIDQAEQHPWSFTSFLVDQSKEVFEVDTQWACLGRYPNSLGDYSIEGHIGKVAIERKSREDAQSTILGFKQGEERTGRRDRFKQELSNLEKVTYPLVIVESSLLGLLASVQDYGTKTIETQQKILFRSVLSYMQDYRVPWLFCDTRRMAEAAAFRFFQRYWKYHGNPTKAA